MVYSVTKFRQNDLMCVVPQNAQEIAATELDRMAKLVDFTHAWTLRRRSAPIACGGVQVLWKGNADAWTFVDRSMTSADLLHLTRFLLEMIDVLHVRLGLRRLGATTIADWSPGERWLQRLGFQAEGVLRCFDAQGRDHRIYSRIWPSCPSLPASSARPLLLAV